MTSLARRRWANTAVTMLLAGLMLALYELSQLSLEDSQILTGWGLVTLFTVLILFTVRKRLPMLPLPNAAVWLQMHIYAGWLTGLLFLLHTDFEWPTGTLDIWLWGLAVSLWLSGVLGLALTRCLPRLTVSIGPRVLFEAIPMERRRLAEGVKALATASAAETTSTTILDFYRRELHGFFLGPRHAVAHLIGSRRHLRRLQRNIDSLQRYVDEAGRSALDRMAAMVREKDALDHQFATQAALKLWLFVHVPLTWAMVPVIAVHVVLAYAFGVAGR